MAKPATAGMLATITHLFAGCAGAPGGCRRIDLGARPARAEYLGNLNGSTVWRLEPAGLNR